ncbi:hypothetical protein BCON_0297g00110 [Botryotinia convoluta]|uniref:Uncharacterized protein n=1 Tax=Botryotinia convoluta TaxID=54673 RepID=A0A4Z1HD43_9HELO|nr:hypothetical protein BCON_0297g00110 [Botryotinia convoluta]
MNGQDCEIAKDILSSSSSLDSGSKSEEDLTDRIETDEGFKTPSPKTEDLESHRSNSVELYQDHSFDHVLDGSPWSNTRPSSKLMNWDAGYLMYEIHYAYEFRRKTVALSVPY